MTRINPKLNRFVSTNWIFKASRTTLYFFAKGLLFPSRCRLPVILFSALVLLHLVAVSAAGQLSIIALEKNRRKASLPTRDVTRILGATRQAAQPLNVIPMSLDVGDVLIGNTGAVAVRVRCHSAQVSISGKFRVRMLGSTSNECLLYFEGSAGARLNTTASGPTKVVSGTFTLGTSRTRYEVEIPAGKRSFLDFLLSRPSTPVAKVYEGEAVVQSPFFSGAVQEGQKLVADGTGANAIRKIAPEDYLRSAEIYARLDVSQANVTNERELEAAYLKLLGLHRAVLERPDDSSALTALKRTQEDLGIPKSDPETQQSPSTEAIKVSLKPNEKRLVGYPSPVNECRSVVTFRLRLSQTSFVRLVSQADMVVRPNEKTGWELEFDATGMTAGTYTGTIELSCVDCANKQCQYAGRRFQITLNVL